MSRMSHSSSSLGVGKKSGALLSSICRTTKLLGRYRIARLRTFSGRPSLIALETFLTKAIRGLRKVDLIVDREELQIFLNLCVHRIGQALPRRHRIQRARQV